MSDFREALEEGDLHDIGWSGDKFTWSNKHGDESFTKECLDRVMANTQWYDIYKERSLDVLTTISSYHKHIMLYLSMFRQRVIHRKKCFKYEAGWTLEDECERVIGEELSRSSVILHLVSKVQDLLSCCSGALTRWSRKFEMDREKEIKYKIESIHEL